METKRKDERFGLEFLPPAMFTVGLICLVAVLSQIQ